MIKDGFYLLNGKGRTDMILDELAAYSALRVKENKSVIPQARLEAEAVSLERKTHEFRKALMKKDISFITEVKKASPSKGVIDPVFDYMKIAEDYEKAGTDAISCLTEPKWFLGSDEIFRQIRSRVSVPMLRKDFTVDEYQIFEAMTMGADAVLLIVSILEKEKLRAFIQIADSLGLDALVEVHDEKEAETALALDAEIIGVNNRNLKDFTMNLSNAASLRDLIPDDRIFVAESGIRNGSDIEEMRKNRVDAVLVGETMMRADDKKKMLESLRGMS